MQMLLKGGGGPDFLLTDLTAQIVTTSNYSSIADSNTQQFTTARVISQSIVFSPVVAWSLLQRRRSNFRVHALTGRRLSDDYLPGWRPSHTYFVLF
jgi:hypothetical protein